jgi:glucose/arabinose dehydrogenase
MKNITLFLGLFWIATLVQAQQVVLLNFASGLSGITDIKHAGDERLFVVEQQGRIKILDLNGTINPDNFLNITPKVSSGGERGLLGLAFSPDYANDGYFYVNYTNTSGNTVISRFSVSTNNPDKADSLSEMILMTINQPYTNHNGGHIAFGPDGYLYIGMGDGGSGGDPQDRSQNPTELLGKMLRIDPGGGGTYSVPASNPFVSNPGYQPEIWSLGVRNPWRFSFDRITGDLWIADVGQALWEEINFQPASSAGGENWGWRCYEGNAPHNLAGCLPVSNYDFPVHEYPHSGPNSGCSVSGGYVYRGAEYPSLFGRYFYADYCTGLLGSINVDNNCAGTMQNTYHGNIAISPTTFGEDVYGNLYIGGAGSIKKIADTSSCAPVAFITCEDTIVSCSNSYFLRTPQGNNFIYQWYFNGSALPGTDSSVYEVSQSGYYSVQAVNTQFCISQSGSVYVELLVPPVVNFTGLLNEYCINDTGVILTGIPVGGIFSGNGITGNIFDPSQTGGGLHTILYTYTDTSGCTNSHSEDVIVHAPSQPVITQNNDTLFSSIPNSIQWLDSSLNIIPFQTGIFFLPVQSGIYYVQYTDTNGCTSVSDPFVFVGVNISVVNGDVAFSIFPNPASDHLIIKIHNGYLNNTKCKITDHLGRQVFLQEINELIFKINTKTFSNGIYYLTLSNENNSITRKIILMNN